MHEHVSNKCASTEQSSLQTYIWIRRKACCAQEKMSSTSNTMVRRCGGQKTTQCYRPHRLRPAPIDDKVNCTCECEVPVGKRPYCSTGLFCARTNDDGGQHGATEEMSMAGLALASPHLSTTRQDAGEYEKQKHSLMLRGPSSCALHIKVTLNVCTLSELMAVTCAPPHDSTTAMRNHVSQQIGRFLSLK